MWPVADSCPILDGLFRFHIFRHAAVKRVGERRG